MRTTQLQYPIRTAHPHFVAISGSAGTGATTLGSNLAAQISRRGTPVVHISCGHLYRTAAYVACELARAWFRRYGVIPANVQVQNRAVSYIDAAALANALSLRSLRLDGGEVYLGDWKVPVGVLTDPELGDIVPTWSGTERVHNFVNQVILNQIRQFRTSYPRGWIIIDGRSVTYEFDAPHRFFLTVDDVAAEVRKRRPVKLIQDRNRADERLECGPLAKSSEDIEINTTDLDTEALAGLVFAQIQSHL